MKIVKMKRGAYYVGLLFASASFWLASFAVGQDKAAEPANPPDKQEKQPDKSADKASESLRPIRIAMFDVDVLKGVELEGPAIADHINTMLSAMPQVTVVNRDQIKKVADEHQIALSGLVDNSSAVKLGKFLSAQYIIVGRASKIGQTFYLVLKVIDVETTVQTTVSAKAAAESGFEAVLQRLSEPLTADVRRLQRPTTEPENTVLAELRKLARPLAGKVLLVSVEEAHVGHPLRDPAAQMAIMQRLRSLGLLVIVPKAPVDDWKESLLQTGRYGEKKVDFLLEGEGTSAFAAQIHGLTSCRARVELRLVAVPGRTVDVTDRGVAAGVDLVEALAAKTALEEAGVQACDAVIRRAAAEMGKK
jgi:Peptidoglycan-synthase activator LpoB